MTYIELCRGPRFKLERWGGGLSYALTRLADGASVCTQGDDAFYFGTQWDEAEAAFPNKPADELCAWMWDQNEWGLAADAQP